MGQTQDNGCSKKHLWLFVAIAGLIVPICVAIAWYGVSSAASAAEALSQQVYDQERRIRQTENTNARIEERVKSIQETMLRIEAELKRR